MDTGEVNMISRDNIGPKDAKFRIKPVQQMAASLTGAMLTSLIMTPLDVVKIRLQAQQKSRRKFILKNKCFIYCNGLMDHMCPCVNDGRRYWYMRPNYRFKGTWDAFIKIAEREGLASLWSGLSPTLVLAIPATIVYFVTYEQLRMKLNDVWCENKPQPIWVPMFAGCTARLGSVTVVSPLELIRTKMQSKSLSWCEMNEVVKDLVQSHGYRGLWKGLLPTLLRDVPFSGIYWVSYESLKKLSPGPQIPFWHAFFGGAISGAAAAVVTTPFDVVKTHQQIELAEELFLEPSKKVRNQTFDTLCDIHKKFGFRGMFAGLVPRVCKVSPACAIMVSTFEYGKTFFENYNYHKYLESENRH